ncbi:MAG: TIM barrel protein [Candidatus Muirbacterium halophilum]|nr:TIM barrel protein [Candidatus Muirbacterium halophilum]MCK9474876.1 TIM barrel protein [Candidatus Muirbacterium halophilum]
MQNNIYFGTAGIPNNSKKKSSECGIEAVRENNLDAMELEFVRGVRTSHKKAVILNEKSQENKILLSCHCPYYINLNSKEEEKIISSRKRIIDSANVLNIAGGKNVVFHAGFYLDNTVEESLLKTVKNLKIIREELDSNNMEHIILRPELTGKSSQIGSEEDLLFMCLKIERTLPCIDFSHYLARYNSKKDFEELFIFLNKNLPDFFKDAHCHLSGIDFGEKGEIKHLNLLESVIDYKKIIDLMVKYKVNGTVICESPSLENDAKILKDYYVKTVKGLKG